MMDILLTNDDGIDSPGLHALAAALKSCGNLYVIAPSSNRSAVGHGITVGRPLLVEEVSLPDGQLAHSTDGTPSDCVRLAALGLIKIKPDLVVSGINMGENLGDDITYSGTVSAALEGVINGIPSIAVSMVSRSGFRFETAAEFTAKLVAFLSDRKLEKHTFLNINVPNLMKDEIRGVEVTKLGQRIYREKLNVAKDDGGRTLYVIEGDEPTFHMEEGTDFSAIRRNCISLTPLHVDMTDYRFMDDIKDWRLEL